MEKSIKPALRGKFTKSRTALAAKLLTIIVPVLAAYWQDLELVFIESLRIDFMNYIFILPFLIGYILYRKRRMLKVTSTLVDTNNQEGHVWTGGVAFGLVLLAISFIIYILGSSTTYTLEYHLFSLPVFVAGSILLVFNLETLKTLLFPIALLFSIQPYLIQLVSSFWADLSWVSATTAYNILTSINIPAAFTTILEVPTIEITTVNGETLPFTVGVASSGLNSFIGFTVFSVFAVYIMRGPLWKRAVLVLIGYPLLILLNALRITIIIGLAYQWGTVASEVFHLTGGWILVFIGTVILLFIGEKALKMQLPMSKSPVSTCISCEQSLNSDHGFCISCGRLIRSLDYSVTKESLLKMTLVTLIAILIIFVATPPIALAKSPTEVELTTISVEESRQLLPVVPDWNLEFLYRDTQVEQFLRQDAALAFAYFKPSTHSNDTYAYVFVTVQISVSRHTWEGSLITYGHPPVTVLDLKDIRILENPALNARFFAYQRSNSNTTEIVLYWFERVPFKINSIWDMRNVQISLWSTSYDLARAGLISGADDLAGTQKVYLGISQIIASYWQPIKTSSKINALIAQNGDRIVVTAGMLPVGIVVLHAFYLRKREKANVIALSKLSNYNKRVVDILRHTEKVTTSTLDAISTEYQRISGSSIVKEQLLRTLCNIERAGLVHRRLVNKNDEPVLIWKTQLSKSPLSFLRLSNGDL